jgi:hypothetical protein
MNMLVWAARLLGALFFQKIIQKITRPFGAFKFLCMPFGWMNGGWHSSGRCLPTLKTWMGPVGTWRSMSCSSSHASETIDWWSRPPRSACLGHPVPYKFSFAPKNQGFFVHFTKFVFRFLRNGWLHFVFISFTWLLTCLTTYKKIFSYHFTRVCLPNL